MTSKMTSLLLERIIKLHAAAQKMETETEYLLRAAEAAHESTDEHDSGAARERAEVYRLTGLASAAFEELAACMDRVKITAAVAKTADKPAPPLVPDFYQNTNMGRAATRLGHRNQPR